MQPRWPTHPVLNPEGKLRGDWRLDDGTLVEYAGMLQDPEYREKMLRKVDLARATHTRCIVVTPEDLLSLESAFAGFLV